MRRVAAFIAVLVVVMFVHITPAWAEPLITGQSAVLIDGNSGQVLFEKEKDAQLPPASITKILTCILAIESGKLDEPVIIGEKPPLVDGSTVYLEKGETVRLGDLVKAAMVASANDAALAIAEYLGGSEAEFVGIMNEKARKLGARNSNFVNSHGLTEKGHYTSAYDMALIGSYAMKNETFREIAQSKVFDWQGLRWQTRLINTNQLLWSCDGANGIKTGYTKEARNTIVASAVRDSRMYIAVILNSPGGVVWTEAERILNYGFSNFQELELVGAAAVVADIKLDDERSLSLLSKESLRLSVAAGAAKKVETATTLYPLTGKITEGEIVGRMHFAIDGESVGEIDLVAGNDTQPPLKTAGIFLYVGTGLFSLQVLWRSLLLLKRRLKRKSGHVRQTYYRDYPTINRR